MLLGDFPSQVSSTFDSSLGLGFWGSGWLKGGKRRNERKGDELTWFGFGFGFGSVRCINDWASRSVKDLQGVPGREGEVSFSQDPLRARTRKRDVGERGRES